MLPKYVFMQQSNNNWFFEAMVDYGVHILLTSFWNSFFSNTTDKPKGYVAAKKSVH